MSITSAVGKNAPNRKADVARIQQLLNLNAERIGLDKSLAESGFVNEDTIRAIVKFQSAVVRLDKPDGKVDPGGRTLRRLQEVELAAAEEAAPWMAIARNEIGRASCRERVLDHV